MKVESMEFLPREVGIIKGDKKLSDLKKQGKPGEKIDSKKISQMSDKQLIDELVGGKSRSVKLSKDVKGVLMPKKQWGKYQGNALRRVSLAEIKSKGLYGDLKRPQRDEGKERASQIRTAIAEAFAKIESDKKV